MLFYLFKSFVYIVLGLWILLTILFQNDNLRKKISKILLYKDFSLVPIWTLFAPNPLAKDYYIVFRDYHDDGTISDLNVYDVNYTMILHPRHDKAVLAMVFNILKNIKLIEEKNEKALFNLPEFKKLKYILKDYNINSRIVKRQFSIIDMVSVNNAEILKPIIVSFINYNNNGS